MSKNQDESISERLVRNETQIDILVSRADSERDTHDRAHRDIWLAIGDMRTKYDGILKLIYMGVGILIASQFFIGIAIVAVVKLWK